MKNTRNIKVLMIAMQHSAKDDRIFFKEAISLKNAGYQVNYLVLTDVFGNLKNMSGDILNKNKEKTITVDNIEIIGIKSPQTRIGKLLKKVFLGNFQREFINAIIDTNADVYHAHEPISFRMAIKASNITRKKVIFDSHESWYNLTIKERIIKFFYYKKIENFITVNENILKLYKSKYTFKYSEAIFNASLLSLFPKKIFKENNIKNPIIVHEGLLSFNRGLKNMILALIIVKTKYPDVILKIIGGLPKEESLYLEKMIKSNQLQKNIIQTGWVTYKDVSNQLLDCSIGLILYEDLKNNMISTSNKLFNYIASNLAIISVDYPGTTYFLNQMENNIILKMNNSHEISKAILFLLDNPLILQKKRKESMEAYKKFNWDNEEKKLLSFYNKVLNSKY